MNGKTPIFVERGDSTFVFPLAHIRFVEIRPASVEEGDVAAPPQVVAERPRAGRSGKSGKQAAPEDDGTAYAVSPLQRLAWVSGDAGAAPSEPASEASEEPEPDDGELLRRVREV